MIRWADKLYLGESVEGRKKKVMQSIEEGKVTFAIFCIAYASNPDNLLDIIDANELGFSYYQQKEMYIVGLAGSKREAGELVRTMIEDMYRQTGGFSVRDFLK